MGPSIPDQNEDSGPSGQSYPLLDGAAGESGEMSTSLVQLVRVVRDSSRSLDQRLEAFEDVIDSEVGDTNLVRVRNLEREVGLRQLYLKFEGGNPTGTQKDRIAFGQALDALRRGFDSLTVATCGNYGAAIAYAASLAGLRSIIHVPAGYQTRRLQEMTSLGAEIVRVPGDYERALEVSSELAAVEELYDGNPGGVNTTLQLRAYGEIANEIYDEFGDAPRAVAVPVSNGTTLAGIYRGFASLYRRGKTSRMPWIVAGSSFGKNPIVRSYLRNAPECEDLPPSQIRETSVNEPLVNWHSADGDHALQAIRATQGWADNATDKRMSLYSRLVREKEGIHALPASTAGLIALVNRHQASPLPGDRYVAVLTGRRE